MYELYYRLDHRCYIIHNVYVVYIIHVRYYPYYTSKQAGRQAGRRAGRQAGMPQAPSQARAHHSPQARAQQWARDRRSW